MKDTYTDLISKFFLTPLLSALILQHELFIENYFYLYFFHKVPYNGLLGSGYTEGKY